MDYAIHGSLQARILEWVAFPFSGDLTNPGIEPRSPASQVDSLPVEPPGKPRNILSKSPNDCIGFLANPILSLSENRS